MRKSIITTLVMAAVLMFNINAYAGDDLKVVSKHGSWECIEMTNQNPIYGAIKEYAITSSATTSNSSFSLYARKLSENVEFEFAVRPGRIFTVQSILTKVDKKDQVIIPNMEFRTFASGNTSLVTNTTFNESIYAMVESMLDGKYLVIQYQVMGSEKAMFQKFDLVGFQEAFIWLDMAINGELE